MSTEKRQILCILLIFVWVMFASRWLSVLQPTPPKKAPVAADAAKDGKKAEAPGANSELATAKPGEAQPALKDSSSNPAEQKQSIALVEPQKLILGSADDKAPDGYRLEVSLEQKGAGVASIRSSRFDAEFEGRKNPHSPLELVRRDPTVPPSLSLHLTTDSKRAAAVRAEAGEEAPPGAEDRGARSTEDLLDSVLWEVELQDGQPVVPLTGVAPITGKSIKGQQVTFKTKADNGVLVTKVFRLWETVDGVEMELHFDSPDQDRTFSYSLMGPHGLPIEGEWYTGTFREAFFGTIDPSGNIKIESHTANDIVKQQAEKPFVSSALPLRFAGVENQYFANFLVPYPAPETDQDRIDREAIAELIFKDPTGIQKSDVTVQIISKPLQVGPNRSQTHTYRLFAGAKTEEALAPYNAASLASYRKGWIPGALFVARYFIAPTLSMTYRATEWFGRLFGGTRGNWGVAIILLTLLVKLMMFPLGRKQALMAQKTQQLQPLLKELQEKYKDDKEKQTRETMALYSKHGVNPVSGCIPALIQLPIFVGLWQALNSSVALRHSPFLWISDLAAPDMLFRFPVEVPFLGKWFNLLPLLVVGLMLFQTKLFAPPATTPEAEMQQKTMKYMMMFMAVMFYKVPAGLGIYFITSSLWSIGERLLLPKITHAPSSLDAPDASPSKDGGGKTRGLPGGKGSGSGNGSGPTAQKKPAGAFSQFMEKILEEARKDPTYRRVVDQRDGKSSSEDRKLDGDNNRRDRGKPRARPGKN